MRRSLAGPGLSLLLSITGFGVTVCGVTGCGDAQPSGPPDAAIALDAPRCEPGAAAFESDIRPRIERYCGQCHGETPDFGAPSSLLDHASLLTTNAMGRRPVDLVASRLADGTMPPVGMPRLPEADADAIAAWASCGAIDVPAATGLVSSAAPFLAPPTAPAGLATVDFLADEHAVGPEVRDEYRCFVFDADVTEERFVRRFEMIFDETRVLHHLVLLRDPDRRTTPGDFDCYDGGGMPPGSQYLYAWAPGQSALEFPEGGLRIAPGERFIVQIHYNNGAGLPDVRDSSGVRLYLGPTTGPEYGMIAIGPTAFRIPARMRATASSQCTVREDSMLLAGMPHMHNLGTDFSQSIAREAGGRTSLVQLSGWSFETQLFYAMQTELRRGDVISTSCTYRNDASEDVFSGEDTGDEMCFNFAYVTPPPAERYCDEGEDDAPTDVAYLPGRCVPVGTSLEVPLVRGRWIMAASPPPLAAGAVPDGRYLLERADSYVTGVTTPIGTIDTETTYSLSRGQVIVGGGELVFDVSQDSVVLSDSGVRFGGPQRFGFRVGFDASATPLEAPARCPESTGTIPLVWGVEGDLLTVQFETDSVPGQTLWAHYVFRRMP